MGDKERLEQKARRTPGGLRIEEVVRLAEGEGFQVTRTTRGHYVCKNPDLRHTVGLAEPHGKGDSFVKPVYVRNLLSAIDAVRRVLDERQEQEGTSEDRTMVSTLDFDPAYIEKARRYTISVTTGDSDDEPFVARAGEFPYTAGVGATPEESLQTLLEILASTLQVLETSGDPLPEPLGVYSGILHLRVPRRMHQALAQQAQADGVSLNVAATALLAAALGVSSPQRGRGRPRGSKGTAGEKTAHSVATRRGTCAAKGPEQTTEAPVASPGLF